MSCRTVWRRQKHPELHDFYARKLLDPGWAGELTRAELACIKAQLRRSPSLRRQWGFRPSAKRLPDARIRDVAMIGVGVSRPVLASPRQHDRRYTMKDTQVRMSAPASDTKTGHPHASKGKKLALLPSPGQSLAGQEKH